jgi:hypothetical protein
MEGEDVAEVPQAFPSCPWACTKQGGLVLVPEARLGTGSNL